MKKIQINVPEGIKFISDWPGYELPGGKSIVDKGVTGCGYTEFCLGNKDWIVLCSPRKLLLENKRDQHTQDPNILYLENEITADKLYTGVMELNQKMSDHIFKCQNLGLPVKFMVTYDSAYHVVDFLKSTGMLQMFKFVIDEFQSIFLDSFFKSSVEFDFVEYLEDVDNVIYLSATPMLDKYLERTDEFKDLDFYHLIWPGSAVSRVKVSRKRIRSIFDEINRIIGDYLEGRYPVKSIIDDASGRTILVESKEAVIYVNSVTEIIKAINKMGLSPDQVNIICANTPENQKKLAKIGHSVGKIPLKGEPCKLITFCTKSSYIGSDFYSLCASSFVFADPNINSLALDISLDLPQIVGRQRDPRNPFKNEVTLFYRVIRDKNFQSKEDFKALQDLRTVETNKLLNIYGRCTDGEKNTFVRKLRSDIQVSKYSLDFVSISKKTGLPVHNKFIELAHERAWDVSQVDYQDSISVTKSIISQDLFEDSGVYKTKEEEIVSDFLDNQFYSTGIFEDKMRMYCEFMDKYSGDKKIEELIHYKIEDSRYENYYKFYGTEGCKARKFRDINLQDGFKVTLNEDNVASEVYRIFKEGDRYSKKEIKQIFSDIYKSLGLKKTAKATDLKEYFKLVQTRITMPDKSVENGFRLDKKI